MLAARTVSAQVSPERRAVLVEIVKLLPLAACVSGTAPDWLHCRAKAPAASDTDSLKLTTRSDAAATPVALSAGVVEVTAGGVLVAPKLWLRLHAPNVSVCDARHVIVARLPVPPSCNDVPAAVVADSATPMSVLERPAAGPPLPVTVPS